MEAKDYGYIGLITGVISIFIPFLFFIPLICGSKAMSGGSKGLGIISIILGAFSGILMLGIVLWQLGIFAAMDNSSEKPTQLQKEKSKELQQTEQKQEEEKELILKIGETASNDNVAVTVTTVKKNNFYSWRSDFDDSPVTETANLGKIFLIVNAEIKNTGSRSIYVGSTEFSVTDSEGYKYDPEMYLGDDGLEMFKELYKNQKMNGVVVFEVPESAKDLKIQYDFGDMFSGTQLASWEVE